MSPAFECGCVGFVAPVERADGTRAVLKISYLDDETRHEGDALAFWDGDGAVRLLDADPGIGALLLERLEPGTSLFDHPYPSEVVPLCLRSPAPSVAAGAGGAPVHPFALVRELVLANRDFYPGNVLAAKREPWLAIDPSRSSESARSTPVTCCEASCRRSSSPRSFNASSTGWPTS